MPIYEMLPSQILMGQRIEILNEAFNNDHLTQEQKEGMARFLSDWDFTQKRKPDLIKIDDNIKKMLLEHLEQRKDTEKVNLFKKRVIKK